LGFVWGFSDILLLVILLLVGVTIKHNNGTNFSFHADLFHYLEQQRPNLFPRSMNTLKDRLDFLLMIPFFSDFSPSK